jgi:endonuclease/exonuclease/phosphatase (EEP) superfamily protein YafD
MFSRYRAALDLGAYRADPARWFTYQRAGHAPDRVIDYAFTGRMDAVRLEVRPTRHSDHLPLVVTATPSP